MADINEEKLEQDFSELQEVEERIAAKNNELEAKMLELDKEYTRLKRPLYNERAKICARIPNFWMNALINHPDLGEWIGFKDLDALRCLTCVDVEEIDEEGYSGNKYSFHFSKNNFFDNDVIYKEFKYSTKTEQLLVSSSTINWKPGQDVTQPNYEGPKGAGKRDAPEDDASSFFSWFDKDEELEKPIGEWIAEDVFKDPFKYFCGEDDADDDDVDADAGEDAEGDEEDYEDGEGPEGEEEEDGEEGGEEGEEGEEGDEASEEES